MTRIWYSFEHPEHGEIEVELNCDVAPAEHDVGILSDYLEDWDFAFIPKDCPLSKEELARILNEEAHLEAISEKATEKANDSRYEYEDFA